MTPAALTPARRALPAAATLAACTTLLVAALSSSAALACACCTDIGDRFVNTSAIESYDRVVLKEVVFTGTAQLSTGPRDLTDIKGIVTKSAALTLKVEKTADAWVFRFDDRAGNTGRLDFALPKTMTKFHVDTRDPDKADVGLGPALYKEWRVTAKAVGVGMLSGVVGGNQQATLILQGYGNNCTSETDFHAWSLSIYGPKAEILLFGDLKRAP